MKSFWKSVPYYGTVGIVVLCALSVAAENVSKSSSSPRGAAQNITMNDIPTAQIMKKVGEFASRALWMRKGRLIFPTGTVLTLAPKITVPAFRKKPFAGGLNSDFQATWFFYINTDKMGWSDEMHPFPFDRPPFYPFGPLMRPIDGKDGDKKDKDKKEPGKKPSGAPGPLDDPVYPMDPSYPYQPLNSADNSLEYSNDKVYTYFPVHKRSGEANDQAKRSPVVGAGARSRKPRSVMSLPPPDKLPGGERAVLLPSIENIMSNFGFEGRGCMLRAICEIHEFPMQQGYGLLGEMIALFFSISQSPYAESHMPEYLKAEEAGKNGDCSAYKQVCAKSIFKYSIEKHQPDADVDTNEVPMSPYRTKFDDQEL